MTDTAMDAEHVDIQEQVPLSPFTTFGVGGNARFMARATTPEAVMASVKWARERNLPLLVIGGGSNLLVSDAGFPGLVLQVAVQGMHARIADGMAEVTVGAGMRWGTLVAHAIAQGWAGLECLAGIPGLVGATPIQNVGAYGQEVSETITDLHAIDTTSGTYCTLSNAECQFGYRTSRFKRADRGRFIVTTVRFRLSPGGTPAIRYGEVGRYLAEQGISHPALADASTAVLSIRRRKSMLLDPLDPYTRSAGSFFVNPMLTADACALLQSAEASQLGHERLPGYPTADGMIKVPAAWLIEHAGFPRGYTRGNVGLSIRHALVIVNRGGATAREIAAFARDIRARVYERFGLLLVPEPALIGVSLDEDSLPSTSDECRV